jgi:predicted nucleotidyltransferase
MTPTCFPDLNQLLTDLTTSVQMRLGDNFVGVYLQGSFAVGDADEDSDVDFMVAIVEPLSQGEVTSLTAIHASLYEREGYWPKHLEGSYAPAAALRRYELNQRPWHTTWIMVACSSNCRIMTTRTLSVGLCVIMA